MSKVYQCDSCKQTIENPYDVKMKEFYYSAGYVLGAIIPEESKRKVKIHLCDKCFQGLCTIANNVKGGDTL